MLDTRTGGGDPPGRLLTAGQMIDRYELIDMLGAGGFGAVWRARSHPGDREVALKVLHERFCNDPGRGGGPTVADRFLEEARIVQQLRHANVIEIESIIDHRDEGIIAYAMEMLEGEDLGVAVEIVELPVLLDVYARTAETLAYLHRQGIIHRDVKETNIFVCAEAPASAPYRDVKLIDFGVAKNVAAESVIESTATGMFIGTIQSMAPECLARFNGEAVELTGAVDQWALGVSLFRSLTGFAPFQNPSVLQLMLDIQTRPAPPLTTRDRHQHWGMEADLEAIVTRCLRKQVDDRFASLQHLSAALLELVDDLTHGQQTSRSTSVPSDADATMAMHPAPTDPDPTLIDPHGEAATLIPGALDQRLEAARAAGRLPRPEVIETDPDPTELPSSTMADIRDPDSDPTLVRVDDTDGEEPIDPTMRDLPPVIARRAPMPIGEVRVSGISDPAEIRRRSVVSVRRSIPKGPAVLPARPTPAPMPAAKPAPRTRPAASFAARVPATRQTPYARDAELPLEAPPPTVPTAAMVVIVVASIVIAFCLGWFLRIAA